MLIDIFENKQRMLQDRIQSINNEIRRAIVGSESVQASDLNQYGYSAASVGILNGRPVKRVIIIMRGNGCEWATTENGGCTMCGHLAGSYIGQEMSPENFIKQFDEAFNKY
ncbi:hypothetical protein LJC32_06395 [Oscillospiraceae bacterium OttesenSCG-928-F05]|nr:hypothetical protein [Oscillospiraceae bacterium OttesenSCG-928-F05]